MKAEAIASTGGLDMESIIAAVKQQTPILTNANDPPDYAPPINTLSEEQAKGHDSKWHPSTPTSPEHASFLDSVRNEAAISDVLASPYSSWLDMVKRPFLLWEFPAKAAKWVELDTNVAPLASYLRLRLSSPASFSTNWTFHYLWINESQDDVVVDISTPLTFSGAYGVSAAGGPGQWGDHHSTASISALLTLQRWIGWGNDPNNGNNLDGSFIPRYPPSSRDALPSISATGDWSPITNYDQDRKQIAWHQMNLAHSSVFVPGRASMLIRVSVYFSASISGGNLADSAGMDFYNSGGIFSPYLKLMVRAPQ
jgi:hypothetical protein